MRYWGCHVSAAGGLVNGIVNGTKLGVNSIQVHPTPPQRWTREPFRKGIEEGFLSARKKSEIEKIFFHAIYLINLANPDPEKNKKSKQSLIYYLDLISRVEGNGVVVHVGSNVHQDDPKEGLKLAAESLNEVLSESPGESRLLLEVSAGSGAVIGSKIEELAAIFDKLKQQSRVGFVLDSQHMWASGYDFRNNLEGIVKELKKYFGINKIELIHLNDSKSSCASNLDRHENLGKGQIGKEALCSFLNYPALRNIPFILETPAMKDIELAIREVAVFRSYLEELAD